MGDKKRYIQPPSRWKVIVYSCSFAGLAWFFCAFLESERTAFSVSVMGIHRAMARNWLEYSSDYDERACPAKYWNTALLPYYRNRDRLGTKHSGSGSSTFDIGLNPAVSLIKISSLENAKQLPVFVNTTSNGYHALVTKVSVKPIFQNQDIAAWASADGKGHRMKIALLRAMNWEPMFKDNK